MNSNTEIKPKYLTVIYDLTKPGVNEAARAVLSRNDWTASAWSHVMHERDELRAALAAAQQVSQPVGAVVAYRYKCQMNCHTTGPLREGEFLHNGVMGAEGNWQLSSQHPSTLGGSVPQRLMKCEPLTVAALLAASKGNHAK